MDNLEEVTLQCRQDGAKLPQFISLVEEWKNRWKVGNDGIYRGHADFNWVIMARVVRDPSAGCKNTRGDDPLSIESQLLCEKRRDKKVTQIESKLLEEFLRCLDQFATAELRARCRGETSKKQWLRRALAQHYEVPTRLIDFTRDPRVALFFAVEGAARQRETLNGKIVAQDSAVWCVDAPERRLVWEVWHDGNKWLSPAQLANLGPDAPIADFVDIAFEMEELDRRIERQQALFMYEPGRKKANWRLHVRLCRKTRIAGGRGGRETRTCRIRILEQDRADLREELETERINREWLSPSIGDSLEACAEKITRYIYEQGDVTWASE